MTSAARLRVVDDFERDWPRLQLMFAALEAHHARILQRPIAPEHLEKQRSRLSKAWSRGRARILLVEVDGAPAGSAQAVIIDSPGLFRERIGFMNNFYIREDLRGSPLVRRMHSDLEGWLRDNGIAEVQRTTYIANQRALRLWQHLGYRPFTTIVRKGPEAVVRTPPRNVELRRVEGLDADWETLRPLLSVLQRHHAAFEDRDTHPKHENWLRERLSKPLAKGKGTVLIALVGGGPAGMVSGAIIKSPSVFKEKVGVINHLIVMPAQRGSPVMRCLLSAVESWLLARGAEELEAQVLTSDQRVLRLAALLGYRPFALTLRKRLSSTV